MEILTIPKIWLDIPLSARSCGLSYKKEKPRSRGFDLNEYDIMKKVYYLLNKLCM